MYIWVKKSTRTDLKKKRKPHFIKQHILNQNCECFIKFRTQTDYALKIFTLSLNVF